MYRVIFYALIVASVACAPRDVPERTVASGWFRIQVGDARTGFSFLMWAPPPGASGKARFRSGTYTFDGHTQRAGDDILVTLPVYNTELKATVVGDTLTGTLRLFTAFSGPSVLPVSGAPVSTPQSSSLRTGGLFDEGMPLELGGTTTFWRVTFDEGDVGKLTLQRVGPGIFEAVLSLDNGNVTHMAGVGASDHLLLSGFDGAAGFRFDIRFESGLDVAHASWTAGQALDWHEDAQLRRSPDFPVVTKPVILASDNRRVDVPQLATLVGKPVVLELGASWCSSCHALAPVLRAMYGDLHARGLEFVSLLYEFSEDPVYNAAQVAKFKEEYNVPWIVDAIPGELTKIELPAGLGSDAAVFPVVLFVGPDRIVRSSVVGFPMDPGDAAYKAAMAQLYARAQELL